MIGIETIKRRMGQLHQVNADPNSVPNEDQNNTVIISDEDNEEENDDGPMELAKEDTKIIPQPTPFNVRFQKKCKLNGNKDRNNWMNLLMKPSEMRMHCYTLTTTTISQPF